MIRTLAFIVRLESDEGPPGSLSEPMGDLPRSLKCRNIASSLLTSITSLILLLPLYPSPSALLLLLSQSPAICALKASLWVDVEWEVSSASSTWPFNMNVIAG